MSIAWRGGRAELGRSIRLVASLVLLGTSAGAQVVEVELRETGSVRDQKKYVLEIGGRAFLRGEPLGTVRAEVGQRITLEKGPFALFVLDPGEPEDVPYRVTDGESKARSNQRVAEIPLADIVEIRMLAPELSLHIVAAEVHERFERIALLDRRKKSHERTHPAWFAAHFLLLESHRRLQFLLERYGFEPAARELDDEILRLTKTAAEDPRSSRGPEALGSLRQSEPPDSLVKLAQEISGGEDRFCLHRSTHVRMLHDQSLAEARVEQLLRFAEEIVEGFRREFVDPYECPDLIPDRPFSEFWFGPAQDEKYERYLVEYYRESLGNEEEKRMRLQLHGLYPTRTSAPEFLTYWRYPTEDLMGLVAHRVGEQLAQIHFDAQLRDGDNRGSRPDWLREAMGTYLSTEYLGVSTTWCTSIQTTTVAKAAEIRGREYHERPADYYRYLARECARPLDQLVLKNVAELGRADSAKAWCLLRFLTQQDGGRGQEVLHSACKNSREKARFLQAWREELRWFYDVSEGDPILALEERALAGKN